MTTGKEGAASTFSWFILIVLALMWGSSFILIKKGLIALDPGAVAALRITSASLFLLPVAIKNRHKVKSHHVFKLIVVGFAGSLVPAFFYAKAQTQIDSGVAGVLNAVTPLWVIIIGVVFFTQKITLRNFLGMIIGFAGTVWLVLAGSGRNLKISYYALFIIAATICYGVNLNVIKFKLSDLTASTITSVSLALVGPLAIGYLFLGTDFLTSMQQHPYAWWSFGAISLLGIMGTAIALVLFNKLVKVTNPIFASSVTYLIPIVAVLWGLFDNEILVMGQMAGMVMILAGVFIANRRR